MSAEEKTTPPPRWNLTPVFPPFAGLDAEDKRFELYQAVRKETDKALTDFQPILERVPELLRDCKESIVNGTTTENGPETAAAREELEAALASTIGLLETVSRMQLFLRLYEQEHYRAPVAQTFINDLHSYADRIFEPINQVINQLPFPSGLKPIDGLIATYPVLQPLKAFCSVEGDTITFPIDKEDGLLALAASVGLIDDNPKDKSPYGTFGYLNSSDSNGIGRLERAYASASMFNAKMHERWEIAHAINSMPQTMYEQKHGLPDGFMEKFFAETYDDIAESLENARLNHSDASATIRFDIPQKEYTWDETVKIAVDAFDWMSPELGAMARRAIAEGWINAEHEPDKFPTPNARPGASVNRTAQDHPYIHAHSERKDKVGGLTWVGMIVHEMAHAIAFQLEIDAHGEVAEHNALLHETIAHTAEKVAINRIIEHEPDENQRAIVMRHEVEGFEHVYNGQQKFEHLLYDATKEKDFAPLTQEAIAQCYRDASPGNKLRYYKDSHLLNELSNWTHYINNEPYSKFDYTLAESAAFNIYQKLAAEKEAGRADTINTWMQCMRNTATTSFGQAMDYLGLDLEHLTGDIPAHIENRWNAIEVTAKKIDEDIALKKAEEKRKTPITKEEKSPEATDAPEAAAAKKKEAEAKRVQEAEEREKDIMSLAESLGIVKQPSHTGNITRRREADAQERQR